jgi:hypothetical protein
MTVIRHFLLVFFMPIRLFLFIPYKRREQKMLIRAFLFIRAGDADYGKAPGPQTIDSQGPLDLNDPVPAINLIGMSSVVSNTAAAIITTAAAVIITTAAAILMITAAVAGQEEQ